MDDFLKVVKLELMLHIVLADEHRSIQVHYLDFAEGVGWLIIATIIIVVLVLEGTNGQHASFFHPKVLVSRHLVWVVYFDFLELFGTLLPLLLLNLVDTSFLLTKQSSFIAR